MEASDMEALATAESPAHVAERIFRSSPYHAVRYLKCDYHDGVLTIQGRRPSYHLKQTAQTVVRHLDDVESVRNLTEVAVT